MAEEIYSKDEKSPKKGNQKTSFIDRLMQHSKKIIIGVVAFAVLVSLGLAGLAWYEGSGDVVATLGDKKVTRTEYDDAKVKCDGFYKYNTDKDGQKKCSETEIEDQILKKALEIEAEKRGITATDEEINKKYKEVSAAYGTEAQYEQTIKAAYGWSKEYVRSNLKRDILKEKLASYIINSRDVYMVFVRYDCCRDTSAEKMKANEPLSREKLEKNLYPLIKNGASREKVREEIVRMRTQGEPWSNDWVIGELEHKDLNGENTKGRFEGKEDWEAISKLQKEGDDTGIVRSSGGYFAVYQLKKISQGKFATWEDFKNDAVKRSKIRSLSYKYKNFKKTVNGRINDVVSGIKKVVGEERQAQAAVCNVSHFGAFTPEKLVDGGNTSLGIRDAAITASEGRVGTQGYCDGEKTSLSVTSGIDGGFSLGSVADVNYKALSCMVSWNVNISHEGYESISYVDHNAPPNGATSHLDDAAPACFSSTGYTICESYNGPPEYTTENTSDNDGVIYMKIKILNLALGKTGTGNGSFSGNNSISGVGTYPLAYNTYVDFTATPDLGSEFAGWQNSVGCPFYSSSSWEWARSKEKVLSGDFNGDGKTDIAAFYDYGNSTNNLFVWTANGTGFDAPVVKWTSGGWNSSLAKYVPVDYNGDGKTDIAAFYDYGNSTNNLFVWTANGTGFDAPVVKWTSNGGYNGSLAKPIPVDYNGDGKDDIAAFYDYGNSTNNLFVWTANVTGFDAPVVKWTSNGGYNGSLAKPISVDYNGDGKDDIAAFYDYGNSTNNLFVWTANVTGFDAPVVKWTSNGGYNGSLAKPISVDYNGDGKTDIAAFYDYGNSTNNLFVWTANVTGFDAPVVKWTSGAGNWRGDRSDYVSSNANIVAFYGYGGSNTGLFEFKPNGSGYDAPGKQQAHCSMWMDGNKTLTAIFNIGSPPITGNQCPDLTVDKPSVKQGDPVKLTWTPGANVKKINIKQKPSGADSTLASIFYPIAEGSPKIISGGSIDVVPSVSTTYILDAEFLSGNPATCSTADVPVTVRPSQSGSDRPVPPN